MSDNADSGMLAKLADKVEEFRTHYARLADPSYGKAVFNTGDYQLRVDYGKELAAAEAMKKKIESISGAWDNFRQWAGLGAIPLIPIAVALGLIAAITVAVSSIREFMRRADIKLALKRDPDLTYEQAAQQVERTHQSEFGRAVDVAQLALLLGGAFLFYKIFVRR